MSRICGKHNTTVGYNNIRQYQRSGSEIPSKNKRVGHDKFVGTYVDP